ncbi:hypothetical protein L9F63_011144, partial [Diploptera punctata]
KLHRPTQTNNLSDSIADKQRDMTFLYIKIKMKCQRSRSCEDDLVTPLFHMLHESARDLCLAHMVRRQCLRSALSSPMCL